MASVKSESLTSSWPIWMPFISLCCLIAEAKTSNTMLNNSGESGHPCLVPDLRGKALSFSPLRMILVLGHSYMAFVISRFVGSSPALGSVNNTEPAWDSVSFSLCPSHHLPLSPSLSKINKPSRNWDRRIIPHDHKSHIRKTHH